MFFELAYDSYFSAFISAAVKQGKFRAWEMAKCAIFDSLLTMFDNFSNFDGIFEFCLMDLINR